MTIRIDQLSDLDPLEVQQQDELLAEMLQEEAPVIDAKRGVIRDLLVQPAAMFAAKTLEEQARMRRSSSVNAILEDPTLADDEIVDNIASNYRVTRVEGGLATGAVTIYMSAEREVSIAAGAVFVSRGQSFVASAVFTGRLTADNVVADTDRLMTLQTDGNYAFEITVEAVEVGEAAQLPKGASLIPENPPLGFVAAVAAESFLGGLAPDDNASLMAKFAYGASAKVLSSRLNMSAAMHEQLTTTVADSIIGMGDAEMLRDKHGIFGVSSGGRVDWYVRTQELYRTYGETREATLIEKLTDGKGVWQISLTRDDWPGFYEIAVQPAGDLNYAGSFEILEDIRGFDDDPLNDADDFAPDIDAVVEAVYSPYQTATIRFHDTVTSTPTLELGAVQDYALTVKAMPSLLELQEHFSSRSVRNAAGDVLIKAPIPCFLQLTFTIELPPGAEEPVAADIANDLAALVNSYGFTGRLPASRLHDAIHNSLPPRASLAYTDMLGQIRRPDGTVRYIRSPTMLVVPSEPELMATARTVAFFLDAADVTITFVTADIPEI